MAQNVFFVEVSPEEAGQRLDNFLRARCKALPKACLYRWIRKGNVRVNKKRTAVHYRLKAADSVRIPPFKIFTPASSVYVPRTDQLEKIKGSILYDDKDFFILNKPAGVAVHAGSCTRGGVIEILRCLFPQEKHLNLVHRLDRYTSGCLVVAKKPSVLRACHALWREHALQKHYLCLVKGRWPADLTRMDQPLAGKACLTTFRVLTHYKEMTWLEAVLFTGRKHQLRQHTALAGYPIVLDDLYGDFAFNRQLKKKYGFSRLFLHAHKLCLDLTLEGVSRNIHITAPLDPSLTHHLSLLKKT